MILDSQTLLLVEEQAAKLVLFAAYQNFGALGQGI
jgi:hypothetical protein